MRFYQYFQPSIVAPVCVNVSHTPINSYNKSKNGLFISIRLSRLLFVLLMIGKFKYQMNTACWIYVYTAPCWFHSSSFQKRFFQVWLSLPFMQFFFAREKKTFHTERLSKVRKFAFLDLFPKKIFLKNLFKVEFLFLKL